MADPIQTGGQINLTAPLGSYKSILNQKKSAWISSNPGAEVPPNKNIYSREDHRNAVKANIAERRALGQSASRLGDFMGSNAGQFAMGAANAALDITGGLVETQESKGKNPTGYDSQQKIGKALTSIPIPAVQMAGLAFQGISQLAEATGTNVSTISKEQAKDVGISGGERVLNNIIGTLSPGIALWKSVEEGQKSHLIDEMSNAYADSVYDIDQAGMMGGGKYLFGQKKISNAVREANHKNTLMTDMNMTNTMRKKSDYGQDLAQQNLNRYAGTNYMNTQVGRKGMKIQSLEEIRELLKNRVVEELDVQKFAEGGSILPTGKLHKELNHLSELNEQFEDLTRKGIPVVTMNEGGELEQVAEIERDEICFSKEITDQLEAYWKDGSEEAMIAAGKLLTEEILYNMKDEGGIVHGDNESEN